MPKSSSVPFEQSGKRVDALGGAAVLRSSEGLTGWNDALIEIGENEAWEVEDLVVPQHYLAVNLDPTPLSFERKGTHGYEAVTLNPGALWINPAGRPFSHRVARPSRFGLIVVEPALLGRLTGADAFDLRLAYGAEDPQLTYLARALLAEVEAGGPNGPAFAQTILAALSALLTRSYAARPAEAVSTPGGLDRGTLKRVLDFIESRLVKGATLDEMAAQAGLSPFHFARAFKAAVGVSPHKYLVGLRLDRARDRLLHGGHRLGEVAYALGFSDQAHFSRQFKARFGITPSRFQAEAAR